MGDASGSVRIMIDKLAGQMNQTALRYLEGGILVKVPGFEL